MKMEISFTWVTGPAGDGGEKLFLQLDRHWLDYVQSLLIPLGSSSKQMLSLGSLGPALRTYMPLFILPPLWEAGNDTDGKAEAQREK